MQVFDIEQQSEEWFNLRRGCITGTRLKLLMQKDISPLIDEIVAEIYSGQSKEVFINAEMQRGIDLEPMAKHYYTENTFNQVHEIGFCKSDKWHFLGLSPDGWVGHNGAIEIKCPDTKTHVRYIRENCLPKEYTYQIICYFLVNEDLEWLDFVSFDDRLSIKPIHIIRIERETLKDDIHSISFILDNFWTEVERVINLVKNGN